MIYSHSSFAYWVQYVSVSVCVYCVAVFISLTKRGGGGGEQKGEYRRNVKNEEE